MNFKEEVRRVVPKPLHNGLRKCLRSINALRRLDYKQETYSQLGEDILLSHIFREQTRGFFVDIGAHHPLRYSNTYRFYLQGWRGLNVDAMPGSMALFDRLRPRDINVEIAVSDIKQQLTYYLFNEPALNGFSSEMSAARQDGGVYQIVDTRLLETWTLKELLDKYLPAGQSIDFMSVDVEGLDLAVLSSNDWKLYRPLVVIAEDLEAMQIEELAHSEITRFMQTQGYNPCFKIFHNIFFVEKEHMALLHA